MKNKNYIYILFFLGINTYGQVGIGTSNPQGILHVDAAKNTTISDNTTQTDDVVITSSGNMAIGTINPSAKLDIVSSTKGAIKIVDGTQGENKVLVSDANGVGKWQDLPIFKYVVNGVFDRTIPSFTSDALSTNPKYSQAYIKLNKGKWIINVGLKLTLNTNASTTNINPYWLELYISSSSSSRANTTFTYLDNDSTYFGGNMIKNQSFTYNKEYVNGVSTKETISDNPNFITGSTIINVQNDNTMIYLLIQNLQKDPNGNNVDWRFSPASEENYFNAIPTN